MMAEAHANGAALDAVAPDLIVAHTSDLHIGGGRRGDDHLWLLDAVLEAAHETHAQALILAGDIFDNNRVAAPIVADAARMLAEAQMHVVILPGNHDPATADAIYHGPAFASLAHVHVLGLSAPESVQFPELDLDVWGAPHHDYADMSPLAAVRPREARWHIVVAHGHWVRDERDLHRSWLIHDHEIAATGADYVALGHWDVPQPAGDGTVAAYYSGSPELAKTVNVVHFSAAGVDVRRHPLRLDR